MTNFRAILICGYCNGSGEGMHESQRCSECRGSGVVCGSDDGYLSDEVDDDEN